jgi:hypothetical protein
MSRHSILDEVPEVVRDKVRRALRNIPTLSDERHGTGTHGDEELDETMAPPDESLDELRRICARKGIDADAVIALLSQDKAIDN